MDKYQGLSLYLNYCKQKCKQGWTSLKNKYHEKEQPIWELIYSFGTGFDMILLSLLFVYLMYFAFYWKYDEEAELYMSKRLVRSHFQLYGLVLVCTCWIRLFTRILFDIISRSWNVPNGTGRKQSIKIMKTSKFLTLLTLIAFGILMLVLVIFEYKIPMRILYSLVVYISTSMYKLTLLGTVVLILLFCFKGLVSLVRV